MKRFFRFSIKVMTALGICILLFGSCEYQDITDADYPGQKLYMPAAVTGVFTINDVPLRYDFLPTPGQPYRFRVDIPGKKFIIPLSVYRSGINRDGLITADLTLKNDTITTLIGKSSMPQSTIVIPADKISVPVSVQVVSGKDVGDFDVSIDLDYIRSVPNAIYGIGIGITNSNIPLNPLYKTTAILIDTKFIRPTANFTTTVDATDKKKVTFTNTSTYGVTYSWDFGDGTAASADKTPVHTYAAAGTYNVTLTTVGVTGDVDKAVKTVSLVVQ